MKKLLTLCILLYCQNVFAKTEIFENATIINMIDGDTYRVDIGEKDYVKIRLACADTPELHYRNYQQLFNNHPIGEIASIQIQEILAAYPTVDLKCYENSFDRKVCHIFFGGLDLSFLLIQSGYAYASESYPYCRGKQYKRAQEEARKQYLGLWGYGDWDNPAEWRKNTKTYCNNKEFKNCSKSK